MSSDSEGTRAALNGSRQAVGLLIILCALYSFAYLGVLRDGWCDDDPSLFAFGLRTANPLEFLTAKDTIHYGPGKALTPFQMVSIWADGVVAPRSAAFAYAHSFLSLTAACVALFLLVRRLASVRVAFGCAASWLLLPSTQAVHEFLSTRHYMEGLMASLVAVLAADAALREGAGRRPMTWALALLSTAVAMLSKEIYAFATPFTLVSMLLIRRRPERALQVLALGLLYLCRAWTLGFRVHYGMPLLWPLPFAGVVARFPYMLAAGWGGYALVAGIGAATLAWARREWDLRVVFFVLGLIAGSVLVIYPVGIALQGTWHEPGTWYRAVFLLNTILWVLGWIALGHVGSSAWRAAAVLAGVAVLVPGSLRTRSYWDDYKRSYEVEGRFFLEQPTRLFYSEVPAHWYLGSLGRLYGVERPFVTSHAAREGRLARRTLEGYGTIWRAMKDGGVSEDRALYARLLSQAK